MCNRFSAVDIEEIKKAARNLAEVEFAKALVPRYNVAPRTEIAVIANVEDKSVGVGMQWGFVPFYDRADKPAYVATNATAEKLMSSSAFKQAVQKRRCLIPADGFYEWEDVAGVKLPWHFHLSGRKPFFFAGIHETATEKRPETVAIVTTTPSEFVARYHDRMPVILSEDAARRWLRPGEITSDEVKQLCVPYLPADLGAEEVSRYVSRAGNEGPECWAPAKPRGKLVAETESGDQLSLL